MLPQSHSGDEEDVRLRLSSCLPYVCITLFALDLSSTLLVVTLTILTIYIHIYIYIYIYIYICIYIHKHVFLPSQDSSVWLWLTSREQLMSPECSKHQVLSSIYTIYVYIYMYIYIYICIY